MGFTDGFGFLEGAALEMIPLVAGARVERVRQLGAHLFLFSLYGRGRTLYLVMSLESRKSGFHLLFEKVHKEYLRTSPLTDLFEKYLEGGRVAGVRVVGDLVELAMRRGSEVGLALRVREGAVALGEEGRVLFTARRRGGGVSLSFNTENEDEPGVSIGGVPGATREMAERSPAGRPQGHAAESAFSGRNPTVGSGTGKEFPPAGYPKNEEASRSLITLANERLRREMKKRLGRETGRIERLLGKLESERAETLEKDAVRKKGELVKTHLRVLRKGLVSAVLVDADGAPIEVGLDPALTPLENMNAMFKKYRKLKSRERFIDGNIRRQEEKRDALAEYTRALDARGLPDVRRSYMETLLLLDENRAGKEMREAFALPLWSGIARKGTGGRADRGGPEALTKTAGAARAAAGKGKKPILRFISKTGKVIYAGRNAVENAALSTRVARGRDLWFHALGGAGSHVILRCDKKGEFRESDIADASLLALYLSRLRKKGEGEVVYTYCKNLRIPKNSKEGTVTYHHDKTRYVKIEERALKALLGRESHGSRVDRSSSPPIDAPGM